MRFQTVWHELAIEQQQKRHKDMKEEYMKKHKQLVIE